MFTPEDRNRIRADLLEKAAKDSRISGAAITGSVAAGQEDRWSDIDLAFGVDNAVELQKVVSDWTAYMYEQYMASHHLEVKYGEWIYRVFLLPTTLQVDLAFVAATEFRALAPTFRLVFGEANESREVKRPQFEEVVGLAWLCALHARSCIARRQLWRAEYMISGLRDHALALACLRHGLPSIHGRGMDLLPRAINAQFEGSLVRHLDTAELSRGFAVAIHGLLGEIRCVDKELAGRLHKALNHLVETSHSSL